MPQVLMTYFAAARELAGVDRETLVIERLPLPAAELFALLAARHPRLGPHLPRMRLAVNDALCSHDASIGEGDEVAVLPPVAGGAPAMSILCETPLSIDEAVAAVQHPSAGAITIFTGIVRDHADGKPVARLDYEAHRKLAENDLAAVVAEVLQKHPGTRVCARHRIGSLVVGDLAVVVAASAAHREQAFAACREAIELIKARATIWKKEWAPDGTAHWVNLES